MKSCFSAKHVHECKGEEGCGLHGLPHLICVPVPAYVEKRRSKDRNAAEKDEAVRARTKGG